MTYINFYRGSKAKYDSTAHANGVYFATDAKEIIMNGVSYIGSLAELGDEKLIKSISAAADNSKLVITYVDNSTKEITLSTASGEYESNIEDKSLAMPNAVGGIAKGTKLEALEGKSYNAIFDDLLFPTVNPTFTVPSASISFKSYAATQEVGATAPTASNFTTGYNAGAINLNGVKQANRGGAHNTADSFIYYGSSADNKTLPTVVTEGSVSYKYRAAYAEGPQPKDNKGNDYSSPLAAGTVDSSAVTVYGVYPYYTNSANNEAFAKLTLTNNTTLSAIKFVAEGPNKHAFKLPAKYTLTKTELLNTLSGKYENFATSNWTVTTETISVQGNDVSYNVYTRNDSGFNGESTYNITFSK